MVLVGCAGTDDPESRSLLEPPAPRLSSNWYDFTCPGPYPLTPDTLRLFTGQSGFVASVITGNDTPNGQWTALFHASPASIVSTTGPTYEFPHPTASYGYFVTALQTGTTTVRIVVSDNNFDIKGCSVVQVVEDIPDSIAIHSSHPTYPVGDISFTYVGSRFGLSLGGHVFDSLQRLMPGRSVSWSVSDTAIATIGSTGAMTHLEGKSAGSVTVTAEYMGVTANRVYTIRPQGVEIEAIYGPLEVDGNTVCDWTAYVIGGQTPYNSVWWLWWGSAGIPAGNGSISLSERLDSGTTALKLWVRDADGFDTEEVTMPIWT